MPDHTILATVTVTCDDDAAQIDLTETLLQGHAPFHQVSHVFPETDRAGLYIQVGCQPGTYSHSAVAHITSETGYLPQSMVLQITDPDVTVSASACNQPPPGGPGGGGGGPRRQLRHRHAVRLSPAGRDSPAGGHLLVTA